MAYELKQQLKLSQQLIMTPQLQQAIRLLQLSRMELADAVKEEALTNPVIEVVSDGDGREALPDSKDRPPEMDWQAYMESASDWRPSRIDFSENSEDSYMNNISTPVNDLHDYLMLQMNVSGLDEVGLKLGEFILGNIAGDGYLRVIDRDAGAVDDEYERATVQEIARLTGMEEPHVQKVIGVIHGFDPAGIGARTLRECLLIQAGRLPVRDTVVEEIIEKHLGSLASRNYKLIAQRLGVTVDEVVEAARIIIKGLNPIPGAGWGEENSRAIMPDVFIGKVGGEYVVMLNEDGLPKLKISPYYRGLLSGNAHGSDAAKGYIQERFRSALWFIKSIHQRQRTIQRVVESIVGFQREFFDKGLSHLKPLTLKDVAEDIEMHESTVSRVTSNKYAETPRGIFRLKYFFSSSVGASETGEHTAEYIKEKMKEIIEAEDQKNPLSDQVIVESLKGMGIALSRRTAAKYREALGYVSSHKRKSVI